MGFLSSIGLDSSSPLISGAFSLADTALNNYYNKKASKQAYERDIAFWNMQNEYNTPANQMKRLKEAGLNPNLIYGNITPGNSSSSVHAQPAQRSSNFAGIIDNLLKWKKENEENELLKEQNEQVRIANTLASAMFPWNEEQALQNARKSAAEAREAEVRATMAEHDLKLLEPGLPSSLTSSGDASSWWTARAGSFSDTLSGKFGGKLADFVNFFARPATLEERIRATKEYIKSDGMYGDYYPEVIPLIKKRKGGVRR